MKKERIENGIDILKLAISENISVKKASVISGFSDTYFKNTKRELKKQFERGVISKSKYDTFYNLYEKYKGYTSNSTVINANNDNRGEIKSEKTKLVVNNSNGDAELEWTSPYLPDHIKTLDQLLEKCQVDKNVWDVNDYVINKWDVTSWKTGKPQTVENFQVKAKLKKMFDDDRVVSAVEVFKNMLNTYTPPMNKFSNKDNTRNDNLLEISLYDFHLGKFGWGGEVASEYNIEIATKRFIDAINTLLARAEGFNYDRVVFPIGHDFLNVDNMHKTTSGNTPQDEDGVWQQTFNIATKLLVDAVNLIKEKGVMIDLLIIPGNHDYERSFYLGSYLEAWFKNDEQVNVDNGASPRKYYKYGNVLLGMTHGKYEKEGSLPMLMATERKKEWGETEFHEWHVGHIHRKKSVNYTVLDRTETINEDLGVTIRYMSSISGDETWHHKKGFVGSNKAGEAFIWSAKDGLIGQLNVNFK